MARATRTADRPLQSARVILCEGADETEILSALRDRRGLGESDVELRDAKGRDRLTTALDDLAYESGGLAVRHVTVVLDAEERSTSDEQLHQQLTAIAATHRWRLHLVVLPAADRPGGLETLAREQAPTALPAHDCADAWERCIEPSRPPMTRAQQDKAWLQVWLAGNGVHNKSRLGVAWAQAPVVEQALAGLTERFADILEQTLQAPV